jgi:hypothetical protein
MEVSMKRMEILLALLQNHPDAPNRIELLEKTLNELDTLTFYVTDELYHREQNQDGGG